MKNKHDVLDHALRSLDQCLKDSKGKLLRPANEVIKSNSSTLLELWWEKVKTKTHNIKGILLCPKFNGIPKYKYDWQIVNP